MQILTSGDNDPERRTLVMRKRAGHFSLKPRVVRRMKDKGRMKDGQEKREGTACSCDQSERVVGSVNRRPRTHVARGDI
jgi:hypothetical protein